MSASGGNCSGQGICCEVFLELIFSRLPGYEAVAAGLCVILSWMQLWFAERSRSGAGEVMLGGRHQSWQGHHGCHHQAKTIGIAKPRVWSANHGSCGGFAPAVLLCKRPRSAGEGRHSSQGKSPGDPRDPWLFPPSPSLCVNEILILLLPESFGCPQVPSSPPQAGEQ